MAVNDNPMEALARAFGQAGVFGEKRADFTVADLTNGGLLSPTQRKPFIKGIYEATPIFDKVTREIMTAQKHELSRIKMAGRVLKKPPTENTEINAAQKVKAATTKSVLNSHQFVGEVPISERVLLQNIDREGFVEDVLAEVANQCGVDIAVTLMQGDTTLGTGVNDDQDALSVLDGWLVQAAANGVVYDAAGANLDADLLAAIYAKMPARYIQNSGLKMEFMAQYLLGLEWRKSFGRRATVGGDATIQHATAPLPFWGKPVNETTEMPTYLYASNTSGSILFTDPKNIVAGIQENIRIRVVPWPVARSVRILVEMEIDASFLRPDAVVLAKNISVSA